MTETTGLDDGAGIGDAAYGWRDTTRRFGWWLDTRRGLLTLFGAAFALRLLLAPHFGFYGDLRLFRLWADRLHDVGLRHFYAPGYFADYPPGYLYVLAFLGRIQRSPGYTLLKLPALIGDLALAWLAAVFATRTAPAHLRERIPVRPVVAAAVLFNPAVLALSTVWGQVDVVPAAFVLASMLLLFTGRHRFSRDLAAMVVFAGAVAMKPQSGFLFPALAYALFRRYLYRVPPEERWARVRELAVIGGTSLGLFGVSGIPFGLSPTGLVDFYRNSAKVYDVTSAGAFNLWGLLGIWRGDNPKSSAGAPLAVLGISPVRIGLVLFVIGVVAVVWRAHRAVEAGHDQARVLLVAAAMTSLLAFTVLTRMHERYLFPVFMCLAPLVLWRRFRWLTAALSVLFVVNLWFPFAYYNLQWNGALPEKIVTFHIDPLFRWVFGPLQIAGTKQKQIWSLLVVVACGVLLWRGFTWIARVGAGRREAARDREPEPVDEAWALTDLARTLELDGTAWPPAVELPIAEPAPAPAAPSVDWARWLRRLPIGVVGATVLFNLVALRWETTPANNLNDSAFHLQMVRWAGGQLASGRLPLDGWFPDLSLGSSFFHHYQSLPYTLTALTSRVLGAGTQTTYLWVLYLLLALWPLSVYWGMRLLGWGRWPAAGAALVSPLVVSAAGYGFEHGSYTWQGYGVYTQLFAMFLLPLTWGLTWRAVSKGRGYALAALSLAATIATHLLTGYLAVICVGVWALLAWRGIGARLLRAVVVGVGGALTAAWVLVPLLADSRFAAQSQYYRGTIFNDSYGAGTILGWLFKGQLFDNGRFPILSLLVGAGFVVGALRARRDERARALLGVWTASLLLYFGRATWGGLTSLLPGNADLQMHRFVVGVHLGGIMLAGVGLVAVGRTVWSLATRWWNPVFTGAVLAVVVALALVPAFRERARYDSQDHAYIAGQRAAEASDGADVATLVAIAKSRGGGRIYAGLRANWGHDYKVGSVPVYAELANLDADAIGFTFRTVQALSNDPEAAFDETNPADYEMFDVRFLLLPSGHVAPVPATLFGQAGRHRLYEVTTTGYFQVVDLVGSVTADRTNLAAASSDFMHSTSASKSVYPAVAYDGAAAAPATTTAAESTPAGSITSQHNRKVDGEFTATVVASRRAVVLLKASFDPRWHVTVDGIERPTVFVAPSLVGVQVSAGRHVVEFRYHPYGHYVLLLLLGALTLGGLAALGRRAPPKPLAGGAP